MHGNGNLMRSNAYLLNIDCNILVIFTVIRVWWRKNHVVQGAACVVPSRVPPALLWVQKDTSWVQNALWHSDLEK